MAWSGWNWHLTTSKSIGWLREDMRFLNSWRMPLIFVVSGAAIILALNTRSPGSFAVDRVGRLLLPLAFGMIVLVPPQDYVGASLPQNSSVAPFWTSCCRRSPAHIQPAS